MHICPTSDGPGGTGRLVKQISCCVVIEYIRTAPVPLCAYRSRSAVASIFTFPPDRSRPSMPPPLAGLRVISQIYSLRFIVDGFFTRKRGTFPTIPSAFSKSAKPWRAQGVCREVTAYARFAFTYIHAAHTSRPASRVVDLDLSLSPSSFPPSFDGVYVRGVN